MFLINDILVSDDILTQPFCCDLTKCKGCCCVEGNAGAPLDEREINVLELILEYVKPYMTPKGIEVVEQNGVFEIAIDNSIVTPLVNDAECAFVYWDEEKIAKCAIEKAFLEGKVKFRKPSSCYLYPIRVAKLKNNIALNYDRWDICRDAIENGKNLNIKVFEFLKPVIIEEYGQEFYEQLEFVSSK
ncbi:hypothetical protein FACS1894178_0230 [Bacteroidia bacterium]|nr:hypothetical protein FACS1894178_0230 [Bacteroidia bacterium]